MRTSEQTDTGTIVEQLTDEVLATGDAIQEVVGRYLDGTWGVLNEVVQREFARAGLGSLVADALHRQNTSRAAPNTQTGLPHPQDYGNPVIQDVFTMADIRLADAAGRRVTVLEANPETVAFWLDRCRAHATAWERRQTAMDALHRALSRHKTASAADLPTGTQTRLNGLFATAWQGE